MQEQDNTSIVKSKNMQDSVWQSRKDRQQTEKDIELLLNRLNLLRKEESLQNKKIEETRKKTQDVIDKKRQSQQMLEERSNNKKDDEDKLRKIQLGNLELKRKREHDRQMIRDALKNLKKQEHDEMKRMKLENKMSIEAFKTQQQGTNRYKKDHIKRLMEASRSNIEKYWQSKIDRIQQEHERSKNENVQAQKKNEEILTRLEEEEMSLITKLQKSQELAEQLNRRYERAVNSTFEEFKRQHEDDKDITVDGIAARKFNSNASRLVKSTNMKSEPQLMLRTNEEADRSWLPSPEPESQNEQD